MSASKTPVRLDANENIYGCSPKVPAAVGRNSRNFHLYPDYPARLEEKLAEKFGVGRDNIVISAGSVRLIEGVMQTLVEPGQSVLLFEKSFIAYRQLAENHCRECIFARQTNFTCDVDNALPLVAQNTRAIFIANPNNPTGTAIGHAQLEKLLRRVPASVFVVADEAYLEYATDPNFPDTLALQKKYPNLIILRSFSKIYGLAALRIGFAIAGADITHALKKSRVPFFFNPLSEKAALAALDDADFIARCAAENEAQRTFLYNALTGLGLTAVPSQANFLYLPFENLEQKEHLYHFLLDNGIRVRNMSDFGEPDALRITVGDARINRKMIALIGAMAVK